MSRLVLHFLFVAGLALLFARPAFAVETVRVDGSTGAPRILVDGKPVRARFFFGNPGTRPFDIGPDAQQITFDFTALGDAPNGTMHLRFGDTPGEIYLDDIHVVDLDAKQDLIPPATFDGGMADYNRDWTSWPQGAANTVATIDVQPGAGRDGSSVLHVILQNPPAGDRWPGFHIFHQTNLAIIRGHHYRVSLWAKADAPRQLTIAFYHPASPNYIFLGGRDVMQPQVIMAGDAGARFVSFSADPPWAPPGTTPDWTAVDTACERVLAANSDALLVPRIGLWPPDWWLKAHPDDVMVYDQPLDRDYKATATPSSPVYRRDAAKELTAFVAHCEEKFGPHMGGYHPVGQNTAEWFYEGTWDKPLNGYSPADLAAWRQWLKARYADDTALQAAWHDPHASLERAQVPTPEARRAAPGGTFRDPATEQPVIDFTEFQQQMMADCVCELAHAARQASQSRKLALFFYGYLFEFASVHNGPGTSGHYALRRLLNSPDIDILCSPYSYFDRSVNGSAPVMTAAESIALAGKMYLAEDDTFTYLAKGDPPGAENGMKTLEETQQVMLRNTGECALRNLATWWMDLGAVGWFNDARIWTEMDRLKALDQPLLDHPTPYLPEVAAVVDPDSMMRVSFNGSAVSGPAVSAARAALGRMGAPYGEYMLDDVLAGRVHAKLYVFLSTWHLTADQRQKLLDATKGATCIWCYAPGYQADGKSSLDAVRELTGFQMKELSGIAAEATASGLGETLHLPKFGIPTATQPLLAVTDAHADEILATYSDGSIAVAQHAHNGGLAIFSGPPGLTSTLIREAAQKAGVHLYTQSDCATFANGPYLELHAVEDGPIAIDTGRHSPVRDLLTGEAMGDGPQITVPIKRGETRIFDIGK